MKKLLLIEPDTIQAKIYLKILSDKYDVYWAKTTPSAIEALDGRGFDAVISETNIDSHSGVELLHELRAYEDWSKIPLIFLSSLNSKRFSLDESQWQDYGVVAYLNKSSTRAPELLHTINTVVSSGAV